MSFITPRNCHVDNCAHIVCEYGGMCRKSIDFRESKGSCMSTFFLDDRYFSNDERERVLKDTRDWGWSVIGVEYLAYLFHNIGHNVDNSSTEDASWAQIAKTYFEKSMSLSYLTLPKAKDVKINVRPSELGGISSAKEPCALEHILSKTDKNHKLIKGMITENDSSVVGTCMHRLFNKQPYGVDFVHNYTWNSISMQRPISRDLGCEQRVIGDVDGVIFGGSPDALFSMNDILFICDMKRALNSDKEKKGYLLQNAGYHLAVMQTIPDIKYKMNLFASTKRSSNLESHHYRTPRTHMSIIGNDLFDEFKRRIVEIGESQERFYDDSSLFSYTRDAMVKDNKCTGCNKQNCFSHDSGLCKAVDDAVKTGSNLESLMAPEYSLHSA